MTTKALITRRDISRTEATAALESSEAENLGLTVEQQLPQGILVSGSEEQYVALESLNYRVKLLPDTNILSVGAYRIDIETSSPQVQAELQVPESLERTWQHHLVQLAAPPTQEWTRAIEARGVEVVEPIGAYGLFVIGSPEAVKSLENLPFVEWVGPFQPAYRLDPNLVNREGVIQYISVGVYPEEDLTSIKEALIDLGGRIILESSPTLAYQKEYATLLVEVDAARLVDIARLKSVRWVEFQGPPTTTDERSSQIVAENLDGVAPPNTAPLVGYQATLTTLGLSGNGVIIGICDSGVDNHNNGTMHPDLRNRMAFFSDVTGGVALTDTNGHGTHVAGIAVGNATLGDTDPQGFLLGLGMAPNARFGSVNAITGAAITGQANWVQQMSINGAEVMNNSWEYTGTAGSNYSAAAREFDQLVRDPDTGAAGLQYLAIVFAAGNSGPNLGTVSSPAVAKNHIVVGNSLNFRPNEGDIDDIRGIRFTSGRGPTPDNRILPTIVAPGTDIISARPTVDTDPVTTGVQRPRTAYTDTGGTVHNNHYRNSGTSMAAPHVSGLCALLIEWWRNRTSGKNPSPAMLKALLINGAEDLAGGPDGNGGTLTNIPNNNQGWGRASLENIVLQAPTSDRGPKIFSDQRHAFTANGQEYLVRVAPVDTTRPMRITLVWTDAPGAANANPALVNDLDLEVTELTTGNIYRGNVFTNGFSTTGGAFDNLNNIECVYIQNPTGTYEIRAIAASIVANARPPFDMTPWQDFALVIDNAEYGAADPVSIVPVIDRSGSMVSYGYVDITRITSRQFIDLMNVDDQVGVVSFAGNAAVEYPTGASPTLQTITGQSIKDAANDEIDTMAFGGSTFMGGGIEQARNLLNPAMGSRAMVLLSDGYDNKGFVSSNPSAMDVVGTLPANMPIYSCAMGPLSDQTLLEQIATVTDGRYYYMPTIDDLFEIYNYIRGQVSGEGIIVNESAMASRSRVAACVDAAATQVTFTIAWAEPKLKFVSREPKGESQISIRLRDPRGRLLHPNSSYVRRIEGEGYVVFQIQEPPPGQWYIEVETARQTHTRYTVGGFVRSPIRLDVSLLRKQFMVGIPLDFSVRVFDGKELLKGLKADTHIVSPINIPDLLRKYSDQLRNIKPNFQGDKVPEPLAKLLTLKNQLQSTAGQDILAHTVTKLRLQEVFTSNPTGSGFDRLRNLDPGSVRFGSIIGDSLLTLSNQPNPILQPGTVLQPINSVTPAISRINLGRLVGQFKPTQIKGSYNIVVDVKGTSPVSNTRFCRKELVSVLVK